MTLRICNKLLSHQQQHHLSQSGASCVCSAPRLRAGPKVNHEGRSYTLVSVPSTSTSRRFTIQDAHFGFRRLISCNATVEEEEPTSSTLNSQSDAGTTTSAAVTSMSTSKSLEWEAVDHDEPDLGPVGTTFLVLGFVIAIGDLILNGAGITLFTIEGTARQWKLAHVVATSVFSSTVWSPSLLETTLSFQDGDAATNWWFSVAMPKLQNLVLFSVVFVIITGSTVCRKQYGTMDHAPAHVPLALWLFAGLGLFWFFVDRATHHKPTSLIRNTVNVVSIFWLLAIYGMMKKQVPLWDPLLAMMHLHA